jgi:Tfp pilus assembly protein PilN
MVRVNLIPSERRRERRRPRLALPAGRPSAELFVGGVGLVLFLVAILLFVGERRTLAEARAAVVVARADSTRLHDAVARVTRMEQTQARLAERMELLEDVVEGRLYGLRLMETLARSVPAYAWLERVDREDLGPDEIRIAGVSFANAAVTDLMRDLESSSELQRVRLVEIARTQRDSLEVQQFTLVATLEGHRIPTLTADSTAAGGRPEIEPADGTEDGEAR